MTDINRDIRRLTSLPAYLNELRALTGRVVTPNSLLSAHESMSLRDMLNKIPKGQCIRACIPFEARTSSSFISMISRLSTLNDAPIVLWLEKSNECGPLPLQSLRDINFAFPFDAIPDGIFVVATRDGLNRMVLDFTDTEDGLKLLDIELHGVHWGRANLNGFFSTP